ncbi:MAG TPA: protocatechuate 3,4-dioxygenase subunit alpha [Solirubrobacteraceae bacterium]|jgi:protocatechuate 3,4-dioxygenase alpha subunit|nr:protocatechuate 3,4-dioxygenase subunit alpha [Solirubrobacteraceae bacterium]
MIFEVTPSQTVGPYFAIGLPYEGGNQIAPENTPGAIRITGTIYDGRREVVPDHLIEFWQADNAGRFADIYGYGEQSTLEGFRGFGRWGVEDGDGSYQMVTVKPGQVPGPNGKPQAPHIDVTLFARGMLNRVVTRIYFADEQAANALDQVLATVPAARRHTLLAQPTDDGYVFDVHLQGPGETVFFDI